MDCSTITYTAVILLLLLAPCPCASDDRIVPGKPLSPGATIVSEDGSFALGFFSPTNNNSTPAKLYLGIWYNFYGGRPSFSRSTRSIYGGYDSPDQDLPWDEGRATRPPSRDVIRCDLSKISSRLRRVAVAALGAAAAADLRLWKSRSASATQVSSAAAAAPDLGQRGALLPDGSLLDRSGGAHASAARDTPLPRNAPLPRARGGVLEAAAAGKDERASRGRPSVGESRPSAGECGRGGGGEARASRTRPSVAESRASAAATAPASAH